MCGGEKRSLNHTKKKESIRKRGWDTNEDQAHSGCEWA